MWSVSPGSGALVSGNNAIPLSFELSCRVCGLEVCLCVQSLCLGLEWVDHGLRDGFVFAVRILACGDGVTGMFGLSF